MLWCYLVVVGPVHDVGMIVSRYWSVLHIMIMVISLICGDDAGGVFHCGTVAICIVFGL